MARFKLTAHIFYIWMAFFVSSGHAYAQGDFSKILAEKFKTKKSPPLVFQANSRQEQLILINKDIKKDMTSLPKEGPRTGGGGNSCSLVIVKNTEALQKYMEQFNVEGMTGENIEALKAAIDRAQFFTTGTLIHEGQRKDAMNFPDEDRIVLTNKFCRYEMTEVSGRAMSLLLHEYLGLARVDDRQYQISGRFLETYSLMLAKRTEIQYYLQEEARKDLDGKSSCFKGAVLKKSKKMEDDYGGRYSADVDITVAEAGETVYRYVSKYCNEAVNGQRICDSEDEYSYIVAARFSSATSGTLETEAIAFKVEKTVRNILVVKDSADYHAEDDEIVSDKSITTYKCTPLRF